MASERSSDTAAEPRHVGGAYGLEQEVLGALLQAPADPVRHVLRRHDHHRDLLELRRFLDALEELVAGHAGHPVVGDDHVDVGDEAEAEELERPRRRLHRGHPVLGAPEDLGDDGAEIGRAHV